MERHEEPRKIEVLRNNVWVTIKLTEVKKGETFRLFEPDGTPVSHKGKTEFLAKEDGKDTVIGEKLVGSVETD